MSQDSLKQYGEALVGPITTWHPPLMASVLHVLLRAGGSVGWVTLGQWLSGLFGIRALSSSCLRWIGGGGFSGERIAWTSLLIMVLLLVPLTPLVFFLATFWKDTWAIVLFLWIGALLIQIHVEGPRTARLIVYALLSGAFAMLRHNAPILVPVAGFALAVAVPSWKGRRAVALAAAPLVCWLVGASVLASAFHVQPVSVAAELMTIDLVGLCGEGPALCLDLPWTQQVVQRHSDLAGFRPGHMAIPVWKAMRVAILEMDSDPERLREEYQHALWRHPAAVARLKIAAWVQLLGFNRTYHFFYNLLAENPYGLTLNSRYAAARATLSGWADATARSPARWLSGVHGVWLGIDAALAAFAFGLAIRRHNRDALFSFALLLLPLVYYASYLVMAPAPDFRYMYPATLFVQCVVFSTLIAVVQRRGAANQIRSATSNDRRALPQVSGRE